MSIINPPVLWPKPLSERLVKEHRCGEREKYVNAIVCLETVEAEVRAASRCTLTCLGLGKSLLLIDTVQGDEGGGNFYVYVFLQVR